MSWTPPSTRATGDLITAGIWNTDLVNNLIALPRSLEYTEITAPVNVTATTEATATTAISGGTITYDGATDIWLEFWTPKLAKGTTWIVPVFYDGASTIGGPNSSVVSADQFGYTLKRKLTPSAGAHSYSVRAYVDAGTGSVKAGAGGAGADLPAYLRIMKA